MRKKKELTVERALKSVDKYAALVDIYNAQNGITFEEYVPQMVDFCNRCGILNFDSFALDRLNVAIHDGITIAEALDSFNPGKFDEQNSLQKYFNNINKIYERNGNEYNIPFTPENRDKIIQMSLKTVVSIAKSYTGLGLSLDELISAGNLGLCIAFDKYDANRNSLRDNLLADIADSGLDAFDTDALKHLSEPMCEYGNYEQRFNEWLAKQQLPVAKDKLVKWVRQNIFSAKFNSVAAMWIRAYILIEIDNHSRIVKKPKAEIQKDYKKTGTYSKEVCVSLDAPMDDQKTSLKDIITDTDTEDAGESYEAHVEFRQTLNTLLTGVCARDRGIMLKKYGIGMPRAMLPNEIATQEGLSVARVSQILQNTLTTMKNNAKKYNVSEDALLECIAKMM